MANALIFIYSIIAITAVFLFIDRHNQRKARRERRG